MPTDTLASPQLAPPLEGEPAGLGPTTTAHAVVPSPAASTSIAPTPAPVVAAQPTRQVIAAPVVATNSGTSALDASSATMAHTDLADQPTSRTYGEPTGGSLQSHGGDSAYAKKHPDGGAGNHQWHASGSHTHGDYTVSEEVLSELATASRILAHKNIVDAYGHVSMRHPAHPSTHFLLSRALAPGLVLSSDIVVYRIADAEPEIGPNAPRGFLERHIHAELYKRYSIDDVGAVVHCHTTELLPFGIAPKLPFKAAIHMAAFLGASPAPVFDLADHVGERNDLLIRTSAQGVALAAEFEPHGHVEKKAKRSLFGTKRKDPIISQNRPRPLVLMRGHGATIIGPSVQEAVFRAVYARVNAQTLLQLHTMLGGIAGLSLDNSVDQGVHLLHPEECEAAANHGQQSRAWAVWAAEALSGTRF